MVVAVVRITANVFLETATENREDGVNQSACISIFKYLRIKCNNCLRAYRNFGLDRKDFPNCKGYWTWKFFEPIQIYYGPRVRVFCPILNGT